MAARRGIFVAPFDELTPLKLIEAARPDVLIKGADYSEDEVVGGDLVKSWGGTVRLAEEPCLSWRRPEGLLAEGRELVLARIAVRECRLAAPPDLSVRRPVFAKTPYPRWRLDQ